MVADPATSLAAGDSPRIPYWLAYVGAVGLIFLLSRLIEPSASPPNPVRVEGGAKVALDLLQEMTKLMTALNVAIVGGAGALIVKGKDWSSRWTRADGMAMVALFVSVAVSYYGIYVSQFSLMHMAISGAVALEENQLQWGQRLEYWGTLSAVFFLGLVFVRMLESRRSDAEEKPAI